MKKTNEKIQNMTLFSMFAAILLILGLVPGIGFIPIGPLHITITHIPVIIGAIILGPKVGAGLGFLFGLTSFINATFLQPNIIESPLFTPFYSNAAFPSNGWSLVICFVPRILVGVVAAYAFIGVKKLIKNKIISSLAASVLASFTNTVLVMLGIWIFFKEPYSAALETDLNGLYAAIMTIISFNGVVEAIAAGVLSTAVCTALFTYLNKEKRHGNRN